MWITTLACADLLVVGGRSSVVCLCICLCVQGSADEDSDRSLQDLTSLNHSGDLLFAKKKLSSRSVHNESL